MLASLALIFLLISHASHDIRQRADASLPAHFVLPPLPLTYQVKMNARFARAHFPADKSHYTLWGAWGKEKSFVKFSQKITGFFNL